MGKENIQGKTIEKIMRDYLKDYPEEKEKWTNEDLMVKFDISYADGNSKSYVCGSQSEVFMNDLQDGVIENKVEAEEIKCYFEDSPIDIASDYSKYEYKEDQDNGKWSNCEEEYKEKNRKDSCYDKVKVESKCECKIENHSKEKCEKKKPKVDYDCEEKSQNKNQIEYNCEEKYQCDCETEYEGEYYCEEKSQEKFQSQCGESFQEQYGLQYDVGYYCEEENEDSKCEVVKGNITVYSTLQSIKGTRIRSVKVNLYKINGVCPELIASGETDCNGKVVFSNIPEGDYRVIQLIDKRYFKKPTYIEWNEVKIDYCSRNFVIYVVNTIKNNCNRKCR